MMGAVSLLTWLLMGTCAKATMPSFTHAGLGSAGAVDALLTRVLNPSASASAASVQHPFDLKIVPHCSAPAAAGGARSKLCFELGPGTAPGRIALSGTSGVELARGAAHYLRQYANMSFAWERTGGNQVTPPAQAAAAAPGDHDARAWPELPRAETRYRTVEYS